MHRLGSLLAVSVGVSALLVACHGERPPSPPVAPTPATPAAKRSATVRAQAVDEALRRAWREAGVTPAPRASDATFARRAWLDITGNVPPLPELEAFLASPAPGKRAALVDALLASPAYAEHWTNYWDDVLMGRRTKAQTVDRAAFRAWLRERFARNEPWDRMVSDLLSATGQNSAGGPRSALPAVMAQAPEKLGEADVAEDGPAAPVNGAVNWTLRFDQNPQDLAGSASRTFLGVQIQCAECHDHKTEPWKQDDFRRFTSAFLHARTRTLDDAKTKDIRRVVLEDTPQVAPRFAKKPELSAIASAKATALDGSDLEKGAGTRAAMATWMTSPKNPWFAKAIVNRMWGHMLGRGFYDPVDDMRASNEPVLLEALDAMSDDFARDGFDLAELIRTIAATEAYGLDAHPAERTEEPRDAENKLWGRFHLVPLGPEELLNALLRVTSLERTANQAGIDDIERLRAELFKKYAFAFDLDETDDTPDYAGTVAQALSLMNGAFVGQGARALPGSTLDTVLATAPSDAEAIDRLCLRVLARPPTDDERQRWTTYVTTTGRARATIPRPKRTAGTGGGGPLARLGKKPGKSDARREAYEDLMWAWLNSSEFAFNH